MYANSGIKASALKSLLSRDPWIQGFNIEHDSHSIGGVAMETLLTASKNQVGKLREHIGIVIPLSAIETELIPNRWSVESDDLEGAVHTAELDFSFSLCKSNESYIIGDMVIERAKSHSVLGSLGLAKIILDEQVAGRQIIPAQLQGVRQVIFPRTILRDVNGDRNFAYLRWCAGWVLGFVRVDHSRFVFGDVMPRAIQ